MRRPPLSLGELELLEWAANSRERLILRLLYETGCTISELVSLKKGHITKNTLRIKNRSIRLSLHLLLLLRNSLSSSSFLISTRESVSISPRRAEQLLAGLGKRALGTSVTPSQLRTTRIIHDFLNHVSLDEIERKVGLQSVQPHLYMYFKQQQKGWRL
ncbi:tyrosine-type recombinase/integrase [Candidatus Woesearchaeota archaeon]|nr:tyrosine-type recombinase/integrase [Candidatus Woesearchaeota archaeon]